MDDLRPHQIELQQLGELAGIHMDFKVFRLIIELLNMGYNADIIYSLLKIIKRSRNPKTRAAVASQPKTLSQKVKNANEKKS
ncbi:unnamed protein product [Psylliodes chrysocephalus]|uniref:Uncharacterized protein n=1 Tax=Psylliodes chrysocephalus TaxID=3402493 RepID=A0A9P0CXR6_9CUCU|nr:unnamed protein product [Psylliodes chrysocephala]